MLTPEQIANLPPDTKKEYMQTVLLLEEKRKQQNIKDDFLSFVKHMWPSFSGFKIHTLRHKHFFFRNKNFIKNKSS